MTRLRRYYCRRQNRYVQIFWKFKVMWKKNVLIMDRIYTNFWIDHTQIRKQNTEATPTSLMYKFTKRNCSSWTSFACRKEGNRRMENTKCRLARIKVAFDKKEMLPKGKHIIQHHHKQKRFRILCVERVSLRIGKWERTDAIEMWWLLWREKITYKDKTQKKKRCIWSN